MANSKTLKEALLRLAAGKATDSDRKIVQRALQDGQITVALGERAVAFGGDVTDAVIITGDGNVVHVFTGLDVETFSQIVNSKKVDRPRNYIPLPRNPLFQPRPGEFEQLEQWLFGPGTKDSPPRIGIVGMGGIGKTSLARELAYRYENSFPAGVFWVTATGSSLAKWQNHFANLAVITDYLPPKDEESSPEEREEQRARHICRYQAEHTEALLVLDNVEKPHLVITAIPELVGREAKCTILYTSQNSFPPHPDVKIHTVGKLSKEPALSLLLGTRPLLLSKIQAKSQGAESQAAQELVNDVGYLPLALILLRKLLQLDNSLTVELLQQELKQSGTIKIIEITKELNPEEITLLSTFMLSWEKIDDENARQLFKLACCFPGCHPESCVTTSCGETSSQSSLIFGEGYKAGT